MDAYHTVLLISAVVVWAGAILVEYFVTARVINEKNQLVTPCSLQLLNTGYNYVFICLPVAVLLYVQLQFAFAVTGCLGLTVLVETGAVLAVNGFLQIQAVHAVMVVVVVVSIFLTWLNISPWLCLIVCAPISVVWIAQLAYMTWYGEFGSEHSTVSALGFALLDMYLITSHLFYLNAAPTDWVDHWRFDLVAGAALALVVVGTLVLNYVFPKLKIWTV